MTERFAESDIAARLRRQVFERCLRPIYKRSSRSRAVVLKVAIVMRVARWLGVRDALSFALAFVSSDWIDRVRLVMGRPKRARRWIITTTKRDVAVARLTGMQASDVAIERCKGAYPMNSRGRRWK